MSAELEAFANRRLELLTQWQQTTEQLIIYASAFEARGGAARFTDRKYEVKEGEVLPKEQQAHNDLMDKFAAQSLDVVSHHNELVEWLNPTRKQRIAIRRTDY